VVSSVPRLVAAQLLTPIVERGQRLQLVDGSADVLLGSLSGGGLDAVLSDEPRAGKGVHAALVATSGVGLFCGATLHERLQAGFPRSLDGAPFILPTFGGAQRVLVDQALAALGVRPHVVCEVDDSALMKALAASGGAVIAAPELLRDELRDYFSLRELGALGSVASYYLLSRPGGQRLRLGDLAPRARRHAERQPG
jgi:LysR family transcriptional activator of nhaA